MTNAIFGWISILASLVMGLVMGVKFQREEWLGGYGSFPRRMVRLAHIAFAAIGMLNVLYAQAAPDLWLSDNELRVASASFMAAAALMPASCLWLAMRRRYFGIFALPVGCLATGLILTIGGLIK